MEFSEDLIRGSIVPIILALLKGREMYGYEMVKAVNARTHGALEWKEGTLYPALHRLEALGLIRSRWKTGSDTGKDRKYYLLTRKGAGELARRADEWRQFTAAVDAMLVAQPA